ncbi:hypothetical protein GPECTOR_93g625 [Gonium pectorale]|uniref:VHS domain-containing protein n=1 Tax=Gonium pectorale TaxID=33097 RepID=A0A150G1J7_GONPE|nr:hypothetical protein GPECTOR_93g625 [Gonium pectorale]|eukprot:KXZ43355.1 hypothetical protein GPECTOR_93g625 [Gonium pectorale]
MPASSTFAREPATVPELSDFARDFLDKLRKLTRVNDVGYAIELLDLAMENPDEAANVILKYINENSQERQLPALMMLDYMLMDNRWYPERKQQISPKMIDMWTKHLATLTRVELGAPDKSSPHRMMCSFLRKVLARYVQQKAQVPPMAAGGAGGEPGGGGDGGDITSAEDEAAVILPPPPANPGRELELNDLLGKLGKDNKVDGVVDAMSLVGLALDNPEYATKAIEQRIDEVENMPDLSGAMRKVNSTRFDLLVSGL